MSLTNTAFRFATILMLAMLLGCSDAANDATKNLDPSPEPTPVPIIDIVVVEDFASGDRQKSIVTPNVLENDIDNTGNGKLVIVEWTQPETGNLIYNGNGTFTYTPSENTPSGNQQFNYVVNNSKGVTASGTVTLNIRGSWGQLIEHASAQFLGSRQSLTDNQGNIFLVYVTDEPILKAYNATLRKWTTPTLIPDLPVPPQLTRFCVPATCQVWAAPLGDGKLLIFQSNTFQEIYTRAFDITDQTLSSPQLFLSTTTGFSDFWIALDENNNILAMVNKGVDVGNVTVAKWYSASESIWKDEHIIFQPGERFPKVWFKQGSPLLTQLSNGSYKVIHYDLASDTWISIDPLVSPDIAIYPNPVTHVDTKGNILAIWRPANSTLSTTIYANYYKHSTTKSNWSDLLTVPITNAAIPDINTESLQFFELANGNTAIIWRVRETLNGVPTTHYWSDYFDSSNIAFKSSSTKILSSLSSAYPMINLDKFDNLTFVGTQSGTDPTINISFIANRMSPTGSWSESRVIAPDSELNFQKRLGALESDILGNSVFLYLIYEQELNSNTLMTVEFDNLTNEWTQPVVLAIAEFSIDAYALFKTDDQQLIAVWSKLYTDQDGIGQFSLSSAFRIGTQQWEPPKLIADQLKAFAAPVQLIVDADKNMHLLWGRDLTFKPSYWTAYYSAREAKWDNTLEIIPNNDDAYFQYKVYDVGPGAIQLIGTKESFDLFSHSTTLFSIDYR